MRYRVRAKSQLGRTVIHEVYGLKIKLFKLFHALDEALAGGAVDSILLSSVKELAGNWGECAIGSGGLVQW